MAAAFVAYREVAADVMNLFGREEECVTRQGGKNFPPQDERDLCRRVATRNTNVCRGAP